jgi:hypothetical protein
LAAPEDEFAATCHARLIGAVAVATEQWRAQHRAFIVETVVKTQRTFLKHFIISHYGKVFLPQYHTFMGRKLQNECFRTMKKKKHRTICVQCDRHRTASL